MADERDAPGGAAPGRAGPGERPAPEPRPVDRATARRRIEADAVARFKARPADTGIRRTGRALEAHEPAPTTEWIVVVPVKGTTGAKSRFGGDPARREALAAAVALDTLDAVSRTEGVVAVLVVTSPEGAAALDDSDALVLVEDEPAGLGAAVELGVETAAAMGAPGRGIAVLLGDLPALRPGELAAALAAAREHDRAFVPDASGTGTSLITAADGVAHAAAFGAGSAAAHAAAGYSPLEVDPGSGLRRDVDDRAALDAIAGRVGPRTADWLDTGDSEGKSSNPLADSNA
ncbi:2-phospho-L-lactate guanylyltransferase [Galbitalea sp. SE-J8]|uniref:2-phospho-L-lactate guanylyltransferase n=1 Tax=Galbitalea sp. SE-J8 TaxID=3054952 RepID=UPI00259D07CB|nr:2-phospho-L-lactate guanylyltransferase [Galbitalea sp. SE-J8]MDM4762944.1 2-phospho-L-lactate guanylyltransferase [Galbitalea sp. SE-J8]